MGRGGPIIDTGLDRSILGGGQLGLALAVAQARARQDEMELAGLTQYRDDSLLQDAMQFDAQLGFRQGDALRLAAQHGDDVRLRQGELNRKIAADQLEEQQRLAMARFIGGGAVGAGGGGAGEYPGAPYAMAPGPGVGGLDAETAASLPSQVLQHQLTGSLDDQRKIALDDHIRTLRMQRAGALSTQLYKLGVPVLEWRGHFDANELDDLIPQYVTDAEEQEELQAIMSMGYSEPEAMAFLVADQGGFKLPEQRYAGSGQFAQDQADAQALLPSLANNPAKAGAFVRARERGLVNQEDANISGRRMSASDVNLDDAVMEADDRLWELERALKRAEKEAEDASVDPPGWFGTGEPPRVAADKKVSGIEHEIATVRKQRREAVQRARQGGKAPAASRAEASNVATDEDLAAALKQAGGDIDKAERILQQQGKR